MTRFKELTGFSEDSPDQVRANLDLDGVKLRSKVNDQQWICGSLTTPKLGDLREQTQGFSFQSGHLSLAELVGNVQHFHIDPSNAGALFQAASQFNLLEMVGPSVTPEQGIGRYEKDRTQGPACAIAAGAGTIYRNYFVEVNDLIGQTAHNQIDCLADLGKALGNENEQLWRMQNGYALASQEGLKEIKEQLTKLDESGLDALRKELRIGIQWNTQVTMNNCQHRVSQAYCSALPVAYSELSGTLWSEFAQLVLEASYEATFHAAVLNAHTSGCKKLFLTLLGGGAFGNQSSWIAKAILRSLRLFKSVPLEVYLVSYGQSDPLVQGIIQQFQEEV